MSDIDNELYRELFEIKAKIAPVLGLKPFKGRWNKQQVIWAHNQEEADTLKLGQDIFKFVSQALNKLPKQGQTKD